MAFGGIMGGPLSPTPEAKPSKTGRYMGKSGPRGRVCRKQPSKTSKVLKPTPSLQGGGQADRTLALKKGVEKGREKMRKDAE